jgi:hypothetical protein
MDFSVEDIVLDGTGRARLMQDKFDHGMKDQEKKGRRQKSESTPVLTADNKVAACPPGSGGFAE